MERLFITIICQLVLALVCALISPVHAMDCADKQGFQAQLSCFSAEVTKEIDASADTAEVKSKAKKDLQRAVDIANKLEAKFTDMTDVMIIYEMIKLVMDVTEQADSFTGTDGKGCRNYYVYMFSKDINVYSKFWIPKSKLDNGTGLKHNGAIERTLGVFTVPMDSEAQLRSKEYLGLIDRKLVEVKNDKLVYVNDNLVIAIPGEETSCSK